MNMISAVTNLFGFVSFSWIISRLNALIVLFLAVMSLVTVANRMGVFPAAVHERILR